MKKLKIYFLFSIILFFYTVTSISQNNNYVTLDGKQFKYGNGDPFFPICINYCIRIAQDFGTQNYYISPYNGYGPSKNFDCNSQTNCDYYIDKDFERITQMGFNTIHLMGLTPYTDPMLKDETRLTGLYVWTAPNVDQYSPDWNDNDYHYLGHPPYDNNSWIQMLLSYIYHVTSLAHDHGLKVILDCQQNDQFMTGANYTDLDDYLRVLAHFINTSTDQDFKETIMAYILVGEPTIADDGNNLVRSKQNVCDWTEMWYNTLKENDPHHLVGAGGTYYMETFSWDPGSEKVDFWFPHFYPYYKPYELTEIGHNQVNALERVKGALYWMNQTCPVPWFVGETGLSAPPTRMYCNSDGDYSDQAQYINSTIRRIQNCGGSGYSVWQYQEVFHDNCVSDFFGLLKHGNQWDDNEFPKLCKDAVQEIINFPTYTLLPCDKPDYYYDPDYHQLYDPNPNPKNIEGWLDDGDPSHPIENAVIKGSTKMINNFGHVAIDDHCTFTDEDGHFIIRPFDFLLYDKDAPIVNLKISAIGAQYIHRGWGDIHVQDGEHYSLSKTYWQYNGTFTNKTINGPNLIILQAYHDLYLHDITINSGARVDIKARNSIEASSLFEVKYGSETHIFCTETFPVCGGIPSLMDSKLCFQNNRKIYEPSDQLELNFTINKAILTASIFPNPCRETVNIVIKNTENNETAYSIHIFNSLGIEVLTFHEYSSSFNINLSDLVKGVYYIKIAYSFGIDIQKLILQ